MNVLQAFNHKFKKPESEDYSQVGPSHNPTFTCSLGVKGSLFQGSGSSKKVAKEAAATAALSRLESISEKKPSAVHPGEKSPISILYEIFPQNEILYECESIEGGGFRYKLTVESEEFEAEAASKKEAKLAVTELALEKIDPAKKERVRKCLPEPCFNEERLAAPPKQIPIFQQAVAAAVCEQFARLSKDTAFDCPKVVAGIVLSFYDEISSIRVVCVTTGTKCLNGEYLSISGLAVNDCHAEVVARRCLIRYLYAQLALHAAGRGVESIFYKPIGGLRFRLRTRLRFHLYINTAPCGDARIFSPHDGDTEERLTSRQVQARGQLRSKIEAGEGCIPVQNLNGIQTWDGVLQGSRLLTMSCSDKILRWNVLGVQGALLTALVEPIYLNSIVVGGLFHSQHMRRALYARVEGRLAPLPQFFDLNRPILVECPSNQKRLPKKSPTISMNWIDDNEDASPQVEILDAATGKCRTSGAVSRVCKFLLYQRFQEVMQATRMEKNVPRAVRAAPSYGRAKIAVLDYQMAKRALYEALSKGGMGAWIKKPLEQDDFQIADP